MLIPTRCSATVSDANHEALPRLGIPGCQKKIVASVNGTRETYECARSLPGKGTVHSQTPWLPVDYALAFVGDGTVLFSADPVRLAGLTYEEL